MPQKLFFWLALAALFTSSCGKQPVIFYKYGDTNQFRVRAVDACYGDFDVRDKKRFGPYERVELECLR